MLVSNSCPGDFGVPGRATLIDVSARDGLQAHSRSLAPGDRVRWIETLLDAGIDEVEGVSFVNPVLVPQMAGAGEVLAALREGSLARVWALTPNAKGLRLALLANAKNVVCLASATENHSARNLGRGIAQVLSDLEDSLALIREAGVKARVALSVAWGEPGEELSAARAVELALTLGKIGFEQITLCDTYGGATPQRVRALVEGIKSRFPPAAIGLHFHDTFGFAAANVHAGLLGGVSRFDASVGGLGGCPFLPGAKGNMDTANLIRFLNGLGVGTNASLAPVLEAAAICDSILEGRSS